MENHRQLDQRTRNLLTLHKALQVWNKVDRLYVPRNLMTMYKALQARDDVDWLYVPRKEG